MTRLSRPRWYRRLTERPGGPLPSRRAAARLSAYVYGNILALAAVVVATPASVHSGAAAALVAGAGVTTFIAHVVAELVAYSTVSYAPERNGHEQRVHTLQELRDAVPIASSVGVPSLILVLGWADVIAPKWAVLAAGGVIIFRIATVPIVAERIRGNALGFRVVIAGFAAAGMATLAVLLKVLVGH